MNIQIEPKLVLAIAVSMLLVAVTVKPPLQFSPSQRGEASGELMKSKEARLHRDARSRNGLNGYWYRGF
jgi:hypothetical protein